MEGKKDRKRPRPKDNSDSDEDNIEMKKEKPNDDEEGLYEGEDSYESVEDNEINDDEDIKGEIKIKEKENKKVDKNNIQVNLWDEKKNNKLKEGEVLDYDNDAYEMLHRSKVEWPCLSVDFLLKENSSLSSLKDFFISNDKRKMTEDKYPYTTYIISGSQTNEKDGYFYFMKWYNMRKTKYDDDPDKADEDENEDEEDEDKINPFMKYEKIKVNGNINRVKSMKNSSICALWNDSPSVDIIDCEELFNNIEY